MSMISGTASNNELEFNSFLTPAGRDASILEIGNVSGDIVTISGGTADEAYQSLLDTVSAASPANPFNLGDVNQSPSSIVNLLNGLKVYQVTSTAGHVLQAEIVNDGTGYSADPSTASATSGGSGSGCQVAITSVSSNRVTGVKIINAGSGYVDGETLTISIGGGNATIRVNTIVFFKTLLYTHESHGIGTTQNSTLSQLKSQAVAYTGGNTAMTDFDYGAVGVAAPKIFDEPLTIVSKPTDTSHRVIVGQARNPHAGIGGKKISDGGLFPNPFGFMPEDGIIYSAVDIVCRNSNNALAVGQQITMPANIRGMLSDNPAFLTFFHVLDDDHIVLFTNLRMPSLADFTAPAMPKFLTSASDRMFVGLGFEDGTPSGTDNFASPGVIVNPQYLQIVSGEYSNNGTLIIPTHVKRIALFPKDHMAFLRRGKYHRNVSQMGPDFDGTIISASISTAGTGYGTNSGGVSFTTSGGRGSGFAFTTDTNGGGINTDFTITNAGEGYLPGEILDVVGGAGSGAKVTVTAAGNYSLPYISLPAGVVSEIVVNTGEDCAITLVSTGSNDVVYVQYLTG